MNAAIEITGYGQTAIEEGRATVAQTGERIGSVAGRAAAALSVGDFEAFRDLYRRSRKLKLSAHADRLDLSYGSATLAAIRLPEGVYCRPGDDPTGTAREIGLLA